MSETSERDLPSTFSQLVIMLATSALQQLGQIPDPSGQQPTVSLEGAQGMIDLLEMLEAKTQGNLDDAEAKMLRESLTMLRLQFVEVKQATGGRTAAASQPSEPSPSDEKSAPQAPSSADSSPPPDSDSKTKFRKSYG